MVVGILRLVFHIPESGSLKSKRRVLRSIKDRLRSQFNVSVAEVDSQDLWQRADLAVALVATDRAFADQQLQTILGTIESWRMAELVEARTEIV